MFIDLREIKYQLLKILVELIILLVKYQDNFLELIKIDGRQKSISKPLKMCKFRNF